MPTYILLSRLTDTGAGTIKEHPERIEEVNQEIEQFGAHVVHQYATLEPRGSGVSRYLIRGQASHKIQRTGIAARVGMRHPYKMGEHCGQAWSV